MFSAFLSWAAWIAVRTPGGSCRLVSALGFAADADLGLDFGRFDHFSRP